MKIELGSYITGICKNTKKGTGNLALNIPGLGVLPAEKDKDNEPFDCIILNRQQLIRLRYEIDRELENERETNFKGF